MGMHSLFIVALVMFSTSVQSFINYGSINIQISKKINTPLFSNPSYLDALARAKAAKGQQMPPSVASRSPPVSVAPPVAATVMTTSIASSSSSASIEEDDNDGLPFNEEMYEHLKFVIGKLSARMKSDTPLTREEMSRFQSSCDKIINDAWAGIGETRPGNSPPAAATASVAKSPSPSSTSSSRPVPAPAKKVVQQKPDEIDLTIYGPGEGPKSTEQPDPNSPFASLHGMKSMWDIPGLEENPDITREEYMRIVQNRLHDMKMKRQQQPGFSRTAGEDYLDNLNKKRDHTNQQ